MGSLLRRSPLSTAIPRVNAGGFETGNRRPGLGDPPRLLPRHCCQRFGRDQPRPLSTLQAAEHFEQRGGDCLGGTRRDRSELLREALPVHGAELVQSHLPTFSLEAYRYSCRVWPRDRGHGSNNDSLQMRVHFIG